MLPFLFVLDNNAIVATNPALVAHLYRRAGFGALPAELDELSRTQLDRSGGRSPCRLERADPGGRGRPAPHLTTIPQSNVPGYQFNGWEEYNNLISWWLERMIVTSTPLREKLALLLHCQFPTSWSKVGWAYMMYVQNQIFRTLGPGNFETLVQAVGQGPGDADLARCGHLPQGRPQPELRSRTDGTLHNGRWQLHPGRRRAVGALLYRVGARQRVRGVLLQPLRQRRRDQKFLGRTGRFTGEDIVSIVCNEPASHRWVISRLWSWLAYPITPNAPIVQDFVHGYSKDLNITNLLGAMFNHPAFVSARAMNGLVKQPIELLVGALRVLGLTTAPFSPGQLAGQLGNIGQVPFTPPTVGGWGSNQYWQSTGAAAGYIQQAYSLASVANLTALENGDGHPAAQVTAALSLIGLPKVSNRTHAGAHLSRRVVENEQRILAGSTTRDPCSFGTRIRD